MDLTELLLTVGSPGWDDAKNRLSALQDENLPLFLRSLSAELSNKLKPEMSRLHAGSMLRKWVWNRRWLQLDHSTRDCIITDLVSAMPEFEMAEDILALVAQDELPGASWQVLVQMIKVTEDQLLQNALSPNRNVREYAESKLEALQEHNPSGFLRLLLTELCDASKPVGTRLLAGIILGDWLQAVPTQTPGEETYTTPECHWLLLEDPIRSEIKRDLLWTLALGDQTRRIVSQAIAAIAMIEIPRGQWRELFAWLLEKMSSGSAMTRLASTEALGYVCEKLWCSTVESWRGKYFIAELAQRMGCNEDVCVRLAAMEALPNVYHMAAAVPPEHVLESIVSSLLEAARDSSNEVRLRHAALDCLTASLWFLEKHLATIIEMSLSVVAEKAVAVQVIVLWSTVLNNNYKLKINTQAWMGLMIPLLLDAMSNQGDDEDEEACNVSGEAGCCMESFAQATGDAIVPLVMPFIREVLGSPHSEWRSREAAVHALGSILDGPSLEELAPHLKASISSLIQFLEDGNNRVKCTTVWALGRILEFSGSVVIGGDDLGPRILSGLLKGLEDDLEVASAACSSLHLLALKCRDLLDQETLEALMRAATASREDSDRKILRAWVYEALREFVRGCSECKAPVVEQVVLLIVPPLRAKRVPQEERGLLCRILEVAIQALGSRSPPMAHTLMDLCLQLVEDGCFEAMLPVGALASARGESFSMFADMVYSCLGRRLESVFALRAIRMIIKSLQGDQQRLFCDWALERLCELLSDADHYAELDSAAKVASLYCLGDAALSQRECFGGYLDRLPLLLNQVLYREGLRGKEKLLLGILGAYTRILQSCKGVFKTELYGVARGLIRVVLSSGRKREMGAAIQAVLDFGVDLRLKRKEEKQLADILVNLPRVLPRVRPQMMMMSSISNLNS